MDDEAARDRSLLDCPHTRTYRPPPPTALEKLERSHCSIITQMIELEKARNTSGSWQVRSIQILICWVVFGFQHFLPWSTTDTCIRLSGGLINTMRVVLKSSETLLQRSLVEQVKQCVDQRLTLDEVKWTDVNVFDFISKVTYQVTAQVWVGEALFRNKAFVDAFEKYSFWFNCSSALLSSWTPPLLTSVIGLLLRIPTSMAQIRCEKLLLPVVQARWNEIKQMKSRSGYQIKEVPNDFLTSTIKTIMGPKYDEINSPEFISKIVVISVGPSVTRLRWLLIKS